MMREPRTRTFGCPAIACAARRRRLPRVAAHRLGRLRRRSGGPRRRLDGRRPARGAAFLEEQRVLLAVHDERAFGAHVHLVVVVERVRLDRREHGGAAAGIVERRVDVVEDLAVALRKTIDAARRDDGFGSGAEEPVGGVDLVAAELGHQALRVLPVQPPVEQVIPVGVTPLRGAVVGRRRLALAAPRTVAMPGEPDVIDVAERARLDDAVVGGLVHRARQALIGDLEHSVVLARRGEHALAARDVPRHHLLAEHVLAGVETADGEIGVRPERRRHDDRLEILLLEHVLPVGVMARGRPRVLRHHLVGGLEAVRVDVAERAHLGVRRIDVAEQRSALASNADESHANRSARHRALERRRHTERRQCRRAGEHLQEIAPALLDLFGRQVHRVLVAILDRGQVSVLWPRSATAPGPIRSTPAMSPVRNDNSTSTAAASIRFLLTMRYVPSALASGRPIGIADR